MLVSRSFLDQVGLMREDYFLYFEELDWAKRGRPQFELGIAPTSHVYHKEGASIGSSTSREKRSSLSERYLSRNRILFTRRYYPKSLPSVFFWVYAAAFLRLLKGDPQRASLLVKASGEGMRAPLD